MHLGMVPKAIKPLYTRVFTSFELNLQTYITIQKNAKADVNCLSLCFIDDMKYMQYCKGIQYDYYCYAHCHGEHSLI